MMASLMISPSSVAGTLIYKVEPGHLVANFEDDGCLVITGLNNSGTKCAAMLQGPDQFHSSTYSERAWQVADFGPVTLEVDMNTISGLFPEGCGFVKTIGHNAYLIAQTRPWNETLSLLIASKLPDEDVVTADEMPLYFTSWQIVRGEGDAKEVLYRHPAN